MPAAGLIAESPLQGGGIGPGLEAQHTPIVEAPLALNHWTRDRPAPAGVRARAAGSALPNGETRSHQDLHQHRGRVRNEGAEPRRQRPSARRWEGPKPDHDGSRGRIQGYPRPTRHRSNRRGPAHRAGPGRPGPQPIPGRRRGMAGRPNGSRSGFHRDSPLPARPRGAAASWPKDRSGRPGPTRPSRRRRRVHRAGSRACS